MVVITAFYAGVVGLLYLALSFNVIKYRWRFKQSLGSGEQGKLESVIRIHGNFAEYVPLIIIMLGFLELGGASKLTLHLFGALLVTGRVFHAIGLSMVKAPNPYRVLGMFMTFTVLIGASINLITFALQRGF